MRNDRARHPMIAILVAILLSIVWTLDGRTRSSISRASQTFNPGGYGDVDTNDLWNTRDQSWKLAAGDRRGTGRYVVGSAARSAVPAPADPAITWYLHQELSPTSIGRWLKTSPGDTASYVLTSGNLKGNPAPYNGSFSMWDGVIGRTGVIPSGSVFTATFWMKKTSNWGVVFPRVTLMINDAWEGPRTFLCEATLDTALTTTSTPYTFSCATQAAVTLVITDRLVVFAGYSMTVSPGSHDMEAQLQIEGGTDGIITMPAPQFQPSPCPCSLWPTTTIPQGIAVEDPRPFEFGVKFRASENGFITGIRFYKFPENVGPHIANLWTAGGILLATAEFLNETAEGWQEARFAVPTPITADTTYVGSYHTASGNCAMDEGDFALSNLTAPPLTALRDGEEGGNGVYKYGSSGFPAQGDGTRALNFWVDVVFMREGDDFTPPEVTGTIPAAGATRVDPAVVIRASFSEPLDPLSVNPATAELRDAVGTAVTAPVAWIAETQTVSLTPSAQLQPGTTYTTTLKGGTAGLRDLAGNLLASDFIWSFTTATSAPTVVGLTVTPRGTSISVGGGAPFSAILTYSDSTTVDVTSSATWTTSNAEVATVAGGVVTGQGPGLASITAATGGVNGSGSVQVADGAPLPPDPAWIAPPLDRTVATVLADSVAFLYAASNPVQTGVPPGTIERRRAALLRGSVFAPDNAPLPGVTISIVGHPELGSTRSRADGAFDLVVNGGGLLTVRYEKAGHISADRKVDLQWEQATRLPDVALVSYDSNVTLVNLVAPPAAQVARGSVMTDESGTRQATIIFQPGTTGTFELPDGSTQPAGAVHVRATEFTVGPNGPAAMPAALPATSAYTYAVDLTLDEALAVGARSVRFSQPVSIYVENFLSFPVGGAVPVGYYDREKLAWVPSNDGRIVRVLAVNGGAADLDIDGSGAAASSEALAALGVTPAELQSLATLYQAGTTLWRVPMTHFTPVDCNWPYIPPPDAVAPATDDPIKQEDDCDSTKQGASFIGCGNATLGEEIAVAGTPYSLHYLSSRVAGWRTAKELTIQLTKDTLPASVQQVILEVEVAGTKLTRTFAPAPNLAFTFAWDGKDAWGRFVQGGAFATIHIGYVYEFLYVPPVANGLSFALPSGSSQALGGQRVERPYWQTQYVWLGNWDLGGGGTGGWTLTPHHRYDPTSRRLHLGNGQERNGRDISLLAVRTVAGGGDPPAGSNGDGGPATNAVIDGIRATRVGPDGSLYITEGGYGLDSVLRRVDPAGVITTLASGLGW